MTFFPLPALQVMVAGLKEDLSKLRTFNTELAGKLAGIDRRLQVQLQQADALSRRQAYAQQASEYLGRRNTAAHTAALAGQRGSWTVSAYLRRAAWAPVPTSKDTVFPDLLDATRQQTLIFRLSRLNLGSLQELAEEFIAGSAWALLGLLADEVGGRGGDDAARLAFRIANQLTIPECQQANLLLDEGAHVAELIGHCSQSIANGPDDLGLRMEEYERIGKSRAEALANRELERQSAVQAAQRGDGPPA